MFFAPEVSALVTASISQTAVFQVTLQLGEQSSEPFRGLYFIQQVFNTSVSSCGCDWSLDH